MGESSNRKPNILHRHGPSAYGIAEEGEREIVERMKHARKRGESYRAIADKLNIERILTRNGKQWHARLVFAMFKHHGLIMEMMNAGKH